MLAQAAPAPQKILVTAETTAGHARQSRSHIQTFFQNANKSMGAMTKPVKSKNAAPRASSSSWGAALRNWFFRPSRLIIMAFVVSTVVLVPYLPWLLPRLSEQPEYQLQLEAFRVTTPPAWVPQRLPREIARSNNLPESVSLLDPDLCCRVAQAWEKHPWVRKVKSVRITGEPALYVDVEYRTPVAFVEVPGGLYPIDVDGVLLPPADFSASETSRLPRIRNVTSRPGGPAGQPWGDVAVVSGAKLASILAPEQNLDLYWTRFGFEAILVPDRSTENAQVSDLVFEIVTTSGSRIIWGKAPGADALEPTVEQKLARLDYLARFGSFDSPRGPNRIDIRLFDGISLQPLNDTRLR